MSHAYLPYLSWQILVEDYFVGDRMNRDRKLFPFLLWCHTDQEDHH